MYFDLFMLSSLLYAPAIVAIFVIFVYAARSLFSANNILVVNILVTSLLQILWIILIDIIQINSDKTKPDRTYNIAADAICYVHLLSLFIFWAYKCHLFRSVSAPHLSVIPAAVGIITVWILATILGIVAGVISKRLAEIIYMAIIILSWIAMFALSLVIYHRWRLIRQARYKVLGFVAMEEEDRTDQSGQTAKETRVTVSKATDAGITWFGLTTYLFLSLLEEGMKIAFEGYNYSSILFDMNWAARFFNYLVPLAVMYIKGYN